MNLRNNQSESRSKERRQFVQNWTKNATAHHTQGSLETKVQKVPTFKSYRVLVNILILEPNQSLPQINESPVDISSSAHQRGVRDVGSYCHAMPVQCTSGRCMHDGRCSEGWNRFNCDCSQTGYVGPVCNKRKLQIFQLSLGSLGSSPICRSIHPFHVILFFFPTKISEKG